jgi:hypothetical protein
MPFNRSPIQPTWVPPNCKFLVDDFEDQWLFSNEGPFDFIHGRILCGSIRDWGKLFKQAYKHLKPGVCARLLARYILKHLLTHSAPNYQGWVEIQEYGMTYFSDDDPELTKIPNLAFWLETMKEANSHLTYPLVVQPAKNSTDIPYPHTDRSRNRETL